MATCVALAARRRRRTISDETVDRNRSLIDVEIELVSMMRIIQRSRKLAYRSLHVRTVRLARHFEIVFRAISLGILDAGRRP